MTVTHIAGNVINIDGRGIQRCSICGEKLIDTNRMMVPIGPDGKVPQPGFWEVGGLVRVDGNRSSLIESEEMKLPNDSCLELVED